MKTKTCHECKHGGGIGADVLCKIMWFVVPAEVAESCASFEQIGVELPTKSAQTSEK